METARSATANTGPPERQSSPAFAYRHYRIYWIGSYAAFLGGLWAEPISGLFNPRVGVAAGPVVVIALTQRAVTGLRDDVESRTTGRRFARQARCSPGPPCARAGNTAICADDA